MAKPKVIETAGDLMERPEAGVCHWCGQFSFTYAWATLKDKDGVGRQHRLCAKCHEKVAKGIEDAAKIRSDAREFKPTRRIERAGASDYRRWEEKDG